VLMYLPTSYPNTMTRQRWRNKWTWGAIISIIF